MRVTESWDAAAEGPVGWAGAEPSWAHTGGQQQAEHSAREGQRGKHEAES